MELLHRCCHLQTMPKNLLPVPTQKFWTCLKELKLPKMTSDGLPTKSPPTLASQPPPTLKITVHVAICRIAVGATSAWSHAVQVNSTELATSRGVYVCSPLIISSLAMMGCLYGGRISPKNVRK